MSAAKSTRKQEDLSILHSTFIRVYLSLFISSLRTKGNQPTKLTKKLCLAHVSVKCASIVPKEQCVDQDNDEDKTSQDVAKQHSPMTQQL